MKKVFTLLFIAITGVAYGQIYPSSFDTTAYDLLHLKDNCISLSDEQLPDNPNERCRVESIDSLFTEDDNTWFLASNWHSGILGDIQNRNNIGENIEERKNGYKSIVLLRKKVDENTMPAKFIITSDPYSGEELRGPSFNIFNEKPVFKFRFFVSSYFERYNYYTFTSDTLMEIESESWKNQIDTMLPTGHFINPLISVGIQDLNAESFVFDNEWNGPGDQISAEILGKITVNLVIENQAFIVDKFCFSRNEK